MDEPYYTAEELEQFHQENLERIANFRLMDDDFMTVVFDDVPCVQFLLRTLLDMPDLEVITVKTQNYFKNLQGKDIRMDILARDSTGRMFNVEVQRRSEGASLKRARYNGSILDANVAEPGKDYENLRDRYVIFINERDVLQSGVQVDLLQLCSRMTGKFYEDGTHTIYVNAKMIDSSAIGELLYDFWQTDPAAMKSPILADRVRHFKQEEEGIEKMCDSMNELRLQAEARGEARGEAVARGEARGVARGEARMKRTMAESMLKKGKYALEEIAELTSLSLREVQAMAQQTAM